MIRLIVGGQSGGDEGMQVMTDATKHHRPHRYQPFPFMIHEGYCIRWGRLQVAHRVSQQVSDVPCASYPTE
ncbi:MAG TPA: hypothetical protein VGV14_11230 [Rhodanobacter sp.]|nr:hypothetical protein [Rhodanobacter sp.]